MNAKRLRSILLLVLLSSLLAAACAAPDEDSQKQIAAIVALTQTAYAMQNPPAPAATQPPAAGYSPLSAEACAALNNSLSNAVGYPGAVNSPVPFEDYVTGESGSGCQIKFQTSGLDMDNFDPLISPAQTGLLALGWTEDTAYGAGVAGGYGTAFRKDSALCLLLVESKPADSALCPADQPIAVCWQNLPPQQKTFHLTLNCATHAP